MKLKKILLSALTAAFIWGASAYAADTVGLISSQKVMFQHPKFDETTRILLRLSRPLESNLALILEGEQDPERKELIMQYSEQVSEFAEMDRAITAEQDSEKKNALWEERQQKLNDLEVILMGPIMDECNKAIQAVMGSKGMTVLIEVNSVYYGGTDITEDVIQQLKRM